MLTVSASFSRRRLLQGFGTLAIGLPSAAGATADPWETSPFRKLTDGEWKSRLPAASYAVLRHAATEAAFSSPLNNEHGTGVFACLGCGLPLFKSQWKFDSGTGWPSFYTAFPGALRKQADYALVIPRTEYHCARCLGHQGHVFEDGPRPTGLRYCNNGVALTFGPA
jgi:peptide-methionine (R)-S-oxide reductase